MAVSNAIAELKKKMVWDMRQALANEFQIESRLKHTQFEKLINREELLSRSNSAKHQELWHKQQRINDREAEIKAQEERSARCTADYMFKTMAANCRAKNGFRLIVNDQTKPLITALCFFFSNDPRFESELSYSFSKGIILRGSCGLGKTFLVDLLKENELKPVAIRSMIDISEEVKSYGDYTPPVGGILYLDDVGSEEATVNHYGTKINWFKSFIELYYTKGRPFNRLMFSTNNSFDQIEERYGFRVRSRLREMFNVIDVSGTDLRK